MQKNYSIDMNYQDKQKVKNLYEDNSQNFENLEPQKANNLNKDFYKEMDLESGVGSNLTDINGHTSEDPMTYDTTQNIGTTNTIGQKSEDTKMKEKKNISNHIGYLEKHKVTEESKNNKLITQENATLNYAATILLNLEKGDIDNIFSSVENFIFDLNLEKIKNNIDIEKFLSQIIYDCSKNYFLVVQNRATELNNEFEINLEKIIFFNPFEVIQGKIIDMCKNFYDDTLDLDNQINDWINMEKEADPNQTSLIEIIFQLTMKQALIIYFSQEDFITLGTYNITLYGFKTFENYFTLLNDDKKREILELIKPKKETNDDVLNSDNMSIPDMNSKNKGKLNCSNLDLINAKKETKASSSQKKYFTSIQKNIKNYVLALNTKKKGCRKDNLRATTIRRCLRSLNNYIKSLIQRIEAQIKSKNKLKKIKAKLSFWDAGISNNTINHLKNLEKFVGRSLKKIYLNAIPKNIVNYSKISRIINRKKILKCLKIRDNIIEGDELRLLKIILNLEFSQILRKYVNNQKYISAQNYGENGGCKIHLTTFHTIQDDFQDNIEKRIFVVNELINSEIRHRK